MLHLRAGRQAIVWAPPASTPPRTYLLALTATDAAGNSRMYGAETAYVRRYLPAPVVRVLGIDAAFGQPSYAPGQLAALSVATDAPSFTFQVFRVGGELVPTYLDGEMSDAPCMALGVRILLCELEHQRAHVRPEIVLLLAHELVPAQVAGERARLRAAEQIAAHFDLPRRSRSPSNAATDHGEPAG